MVAVKMEGGGLEDKVHLLASAEEPVTDIMPSQLPSYLKEVDSNPNETTRPQTLSPKHSIRLTKETKYVSPSMYIRWAAVISALGGVLFGYDIGIVSGALLQLREDFCLSCFEREMVVSSMLGGAVLASLTGGFLVDFIGRRITIIINAVIFIVGGIVLCTAPSYLVIVLGRFIVGFAVALSVIAECVYISEISPPEKRGSLVSLNEMGIVVGFLLAYIIDYALINVHYGWRYMFGLSMIPAVIQGFGMCFLPPSPRYLITKNYEDKARDVLYLFFENSRVEFEFENIKTAIAKEKSHSTFDLFRSKDNLRYRVIIGMGLVFLQQITGQPTVLYYAPTLFQSIGFQSNNAATLATVGLGVSKVVFCLLALLLLDRVGRRKCLLFGTILMSISICTLGVITLNSNGGSQTGPCIAPSSTYCKSNVHNLTMESHNRNKRYLHYSNNENPNEISITTDLNEQVFLNKQFTQFIINWINGIYNIKVMSKSDNEGPDKQYLQEFDAQSSEIPFSQITIDNMVTYKDNDKRTIIKHVLLPENIRTKRNIISSFGTNDNGTDVFGKSSLFVKATAIISMFVFVGGFEIGFGVGTWLILAEIYPSALRGRAIALATVFNWGTNLLISLTFLDIIAVVGVSWTFICYGFIGIASVVFVFIFVPETKGKSLEEIGQALSQSSGISCLMKCCTKKKEVNSAYQRMNDLEATELENSDEDESMTDKS